MPLLHPGDTFPQLELELVGGDRLQLPDALRGRYGVVLLNRGAWCPFCTAQLRAFQRVHHRLDQLAATVVSLSVDDETTTQALVDKHGLEFAVAHSADADAVAVATGAFVNRDPVYLQSTGFVLDPEGRVIVSAYSSGAIGRLTAEDVLGLIRHVRDAAA